MKKLRIIAATLSVAFGLLLMATPSPVAAAGAAGAAADEVCAGLKVGGGDCDGNDKDVNKLIKTIVNVISAIAGAIAVIMIVVSGFRYITSGGDSSKVATAKNTLVFAMVGLVIIALAQTIVRFVLKNTV